MVKVVAAVLLSPLAWLIIKKIKKIERIDMFDYGISYNPVRVFSDNQLGKNLYHEQ